MEYEYAEGQWASIPFGGEFSGHLAATRFRNSTRNTVIVHLAGAAVVKIEGESGGPGDGGGSGPGDGGGSGPGDGGIIFF